MPGIVQTEFAKNAGITEAGAVAPPPSPMKPQTVDEVVQGIVELIGHPRAEIYTNPASPEVARGFYTSIGAFDPI